jgi:glycosyltransferase involved in cell wall biosynthesis
MKIILISNYAQSLVGFRGALMSQCVALGHQVTACAPGEHPETARELAALGVAYRGIRLDRTGINPVRDLVSLVGLLRLIRKAKPDIVLNYTIKPVIYGSLAARLAGVPAIFSTITGLGYLFTGSTLRQRVLFALVRPLYRMALSVNRGLFFLNPDDLALFTRLKLLARPEQAQLMNGEGIDLEQYTPPEASGPPAPGVGPVFLMIARVIRDKGIFEYLEAARMLKLKHGGAVFRLVGPFDSNPTSLQPEELGQWVRDGVLEYLGEKSDVRPFLAACSVYVLPSYREGLPRTVLEAMAMGKPVVTTDAPGCRDTVLEGENGFLVPVRDAAALAQAMERFILDPGLIGSMGKRSRELAEEKYDVRRVNAILLSRLGVTP